MHFAQAIQALEESSASDCIARQGVVSDRQRLFQTAQEVLNQLAQELAFKEYFAKRRRSYIPSYYPGPLRLHEELLKSGDVLLTLDEDGKLEFSQGSDPGSFHPDSNDDLWWPGLKEVLEKLGKPETAARFIVEIGGVY